MNRKILIMALTAVFLAATIGAVQAQIKAEIRVEDSLGNDLSNGTVLVNTVAHMYGTYQDLAEAYPASATMDVLYYKEDPSGGQPYDSKTVLFTGTVSDGETVHETYTLTELGYYKFRYRCEKLKPSNTKFTISCTQEVALTTKLVTLVIPEPGTLAGLLMALSAFGLLAFKKIRAK